MVTGSGTAWTSITGHAALHTTYNNLGTSGNILKNNLVFCAAPGGSNGTVGGAGLDACVAITNILSDTSLTVNLYGVGTDANTPWPWSYGFPLSLSTSSGSGYSGPWTCSITGGTFTVPAACTATVAGGGLDIALTYAGVYTSSTGVSVTWSGGTYVPGTLATATLTLATGNYAIYGSAYPTAVNVASGTFTAGDVSGIGNSHTLDQVLAYNGDFEGIAIVQQKQIGRIYGGGIDITNNGSSAAPGFAGGVGVSGNYNSVIDVQPHTASSGSPNYILYENTNGAGNYSTIYDATVSSSATQFFFEYADSANNVQPAMLYSRLAGEALDFFSTNNTNTPALSIGSSSGSPPFLGYGSSGVGVDVGGQVGRQFSLQALSGMGYGLVLSEPSNWLTGTTSGITETANCSSHCSATVGVSSLTGVVLGEIVQGAGIPTNTTVISTSTTPSLSITLSNPPGSTSTSTTLTFGAGTAGYSLYGAQGIPGGVASNYERIIDLTGNGVLARDENNGIVVTGYSGNDSGQTYQLNASNGVISGSAFVSADTRFTTSGGCSVSSPTGGAAAGRMTLGTKNCSLTINLNGATGLNAPNGWSCHANDETTAGIVIQETSSNATTVTLAVPSTAGSADVLDFACMAF